MAASRCTGAAVYGRPGRCPGARRGARARGSPSVTRKRSPVGHAGHPGDLARGEHDGHARAARARDLAVGEEVLERRGCRRGRAGACGRPARHARTSSGGGERVERRACRRASGRSGADARTRARRRANAARPGTGERGGRAGPAAARRARSAARPYSTTARRPPPRSSAALPPRAPSARISSARAPTAGARPPGGVVGEPLDGEARERGRAAPASAGASLASGSSAASTAASSTSASSRSTPSVRSTLASAAGWTARSACSRPWRTRLRAKASASRCVGSSRQARPRSAQ